MQDSLSENHLKDLISLQNSPTEILKYLARNGFDLKKLSELIPTNETEFPYARKIIGFSANCEVMIARWAKNKECAPHDHGQSKGWVFFLKGNFTEKLYQFKNDQLMPCGLEHRPESFTSEIQTSDIHSCICDESGLSLHVYFPPIHHMKVYDLKQKKTFTVGDHCGAWLPNESSTNEIIDSFNWPTEMPAAHI